MDSFWIYCKKKISVWEMSWPWPTFHTAVIIMKIFYWICPALIFGMWIHFNTSINEFDLNLSCMMKILFCYWFLLVLPYNLVYLILSAFKMILISLITLRYHTLIHFVVFNFTSFLFIWILHILKIPNLAILSE